MGSAGFVEKRFTDFFKQNAEHRTQNTGEDQKLINRRVRGGTQRKALNWGKSVSCKGGVFTTEFNEDTEKTKFREKERFLYKRCFSPQSHREHPSTSSGRQRKSGNG